MFSTICGFRYLLRAGNIVPGTERKWDHSSLNPGSPLASPRLKAAGYHLSHENPPDWRLLSGFSWAVGTLSTRDWHSHRISFHGSWVPLRLQCHGGTAQDIFGHREVLGVGNCKVVSDFLPRTVNVVFCIMGNTLSLWKPTKIEAKVSVLKNQIILFLSRWSVVFSKRTNDKMRGKKEIKTVF